MLRIIVVIDIVVLCLLLKASYCVIIVDCCVFVVLP
jgi:hypothetical protein